MPTSEAKGQLAEKRVAFRARMEQQGARRAFENFSGRTAMVLPGGGARGAYEAGALLAFQDAQLPTHILSATSVGSINAAGYAAHSETLVGNAEPLVETWHDLTPTAVGIEWTRYAWMLGGLIAASAGFGNLIRYLLAERGVALHLHDPRLTWFALGLAGTAVLLFYDHLPYLLYILRNTFRRTTWKPDRKKALWSLAANAVVWSFVGLAVHSLHMHARFQALLETHPVGALLVVVGMAVLVGLYYGLERSLSQQFHRFLRLPLHGGLFPNFERGRLLRQRIPVDALRASPIRVVFTTTDLEAGTVRYFSNAPPEALAALPGADRRFVAEEVSTTDDLMRAVIASSALPIVYEPIELAGRQYTDGAIVATQPLRPAIRLGADVVFVVVMDPPGRTRRELKTFIDVGLRALDILMSQSLVTDLKILGDINTACESAAAESGARPEEVEIDFGTRCFRYIKIFTIRPEAPLAGTVLDFAGETIAADVLRGYSDACAQIENFLAYAPQARFGQPRRTLRFSPERPAPQSGSGAPGRHPTPSA